LGARSNAGLIIARAKALKQLSTITQSEFINSEKEGKEQ